MRWALVAFSLAWISGAFCLDEQVVFSSAKPQYAVLTEEIDAFIYEVLSEWNSPAGISVAVVQKTANGTWITETKGYGIANAAGGKVDADTLFAIGSNSKLFNVIAAGLLVSNTSLSPRISWDTKLKSIIPEWKLMDPIASAETTIVDAMSHRTGLPRHDLMYGKNESVSSIIRRLRYLKPSAGFRDIYQYCNNMYTTLSYLPHALLEIPFEEYVKHNIFDPLGMNSTTYSYDIAKRTGHLANGIGREGVNKSENLFGKGTPRPMEYWNQAGGSLGSFISGAGGILMNAKDVAIWLQTLLLGGLNPTTNERVIPLEVIQKALTGISVVAGAPPFLELSPVVYGGGQQQYSYRGHLIIEHGGGTPGFLTQISRLPFSNFGIAVFSNDDSFGTFLHEIIKFRIIDKTLGLDPPVDWNSRLKAIEEAHYNMTRAVTPPPNEEDTRPPFIPFEELEGMYWNPGYQDFELCLIPTKSLKRASSSSASCEKLIKDIPTILPGLINPESQRPSFIIDVDRLFASHILLEHFDGNLFNVTPVDSRPTINSSQPYWTSAVDQTCLAEFARDDKTNQTGIAFTGNAWGAQLRPDAPGPSGATVQERAEIWLEKV